MNQSLMNNSEVAHLNGRIQNVALVEPSTKFAKPFLDMVNEFEQFGEDQYRTVRYMVEYNFSAYLERLICQSRDSEQRQQTVPISTYWLVKDDSLLIGASKIHHRLTPRLRQYYGHISYHIRPTARQKGYGTHLLFLTLEKAKLLELGEVLLTCDAENIASSRIIQKNGGVFENESVMPTSGKIIKRYRIAL
jgi:predicted acetyltransferase